MTLRGEKPVISPHTDLVRWMEQANLLTVGIIKAADQDGLTGEKRRQITLKLDGRPITLQTILDGVSYHLTQEYPYLLRDETSHSLVAIYSSNLNDHYRVTRLSETLEQPLTRTAVVALAEHLAAIPVTGEAVPPSPGVNSEDQVTQ